MLDGIPFPGQKTGHPTTDIASINLWRRNQKYMTSNPSFPFLSNSVIAFILFRSVLNNIYSWYCTVK